MVRSTSCNAYLFSLPTELEGMPAVVLESLSHKCPVLVSDIPECLDIIEREGDRHGFVHRARDVADLERQLQYLLEQPELVDAAREPGYEFVQREYSWDRAAAMTYDVYKEVLAA